MKLRKPSSIALAILCGLLTLVTVATVAAEPPAESSAAVATTPPPGDSATTPPPGDSATTPPPGDSATTPPPGDSATTPPLGDSATTPPPGDTAADATKLSGVEIYDRLRAAASGDDGGKAQRDALGAAAATLRWEGAAETSFLGHLRALALGGSDTADPLFLIRELEGKVFVLVLPGDPTALKAGSGTPYADLQGLVKYKLRFRVQTASAVVDGVSYDFVRFVAPPERLLLDRLFFIAIVLLLFLVMVGMGLTLTLREFALVFKKPRGMVVGTVLQFGLLPLIAMVLGRLAGFYDAYPFIFFGLILVASSPGGVTSNLMTYLGKGDVALSVSLTAVCTVLSIVFTPLLLTLYGSNIPQFSVPVVDVVKTMLVLVIVPLFVGMLIRGRAEGFAKKAEKPFALLGVVALLFLIVVGIWTNLDKFADTDRYGPKFYAIIFLLTLLGMLFAGFLSKALRINNYQTRAISLEVGLRNASLSMTIALLLQDQMGDFASSMFFASGIFGLWMYFAGAISIFGFRKILPVDEAEIEDLKPGQAVAEEGGK